MIEFDGDETQVSNDKLLSSMAILQVNWEHDRKSYLDNFLGFLLESMRRNPRQSYSDEDLAGFLEAEFAIALPDSVVHSLLRRAQRVGMGDRNNAGRFVPEKSALDKDLDLASKQAEILRQVRSLIVGFVSYAKETLNLEITEDQASLDLTAFIDNYAAPILGAAQRGERLTSDEHEMSPKDETALATYFDYLSPPTLTI
jgi:hypothetical protein